MIFRRKELEMAAEPIEIPQETASLLPANLVPTNLPGVYAVRPPAGTFDPRQASQAELRAQGIFLPRPDADDPPAAHDLWEQVTVTYVGIGWYPIHGEATFDHAHQHVSAIARAAGNLDLF